MTITIRLANNIDDFDKILYCAQGIGTRYKYGIVDLEPFSVDFVNAIKRMAFLPNFHVLLAEDSDGHCVGGLGFLLSEYVLSPSKIVFEEMFWWCQLAGTTGARLLLKAREFARQSNCFMMILHTLDAEDTSGASRAYSAIGGKKVQSTYMVDLCSQPVH
jgi:hypothetical protein